MSKTTLDELKKSRLQMLINLHSQKSNEEIKNYLRDSAWTGEIAVQHMPQADGKELDASLWTLANDNATAIEFASKQAMEAMSTIKLDTMETPTEGYLKSYQLTQGGKRVGVIDIPKDFLVKSATQGIVTEDDKAEGGKFHNDDTFKVGDAYIDFVINSKDGSAADEHLYLNVANLVDHYKAGDGLQMENNVFSVKFSDENESKSGSTEPWMTVGKDGGLKFSGLNSALTEINSKVDTLSKEAIKTINYNGTNYTGNTVTFTGIEGIADGKGSGAVLDASHKLDLSKLVIDCGEI